MKKKYDVFISYRRDGADSLAQSLYDRLKGNGYRVFLDIESMRTGKFNEQIYDVIDNCKVVILILPPRGLDRCVNENDWVRREIAYSLKQKKDIIPVMMAGFSWPEILPEEIFELKNCHGVEDTKSYYDAEIDKICSMLLQKKVFPIALLYKLIVDIAIVIIGLIFTVGVLRNYVRIHSSQKDMNIDQIIDNPDGNNEVVFNDKLIELSIDDSDYIRTVLAAIGRRTFDDVSELPDELQIGILMNLPGIDHICVNTVDLLDYNVVETGGVYISGDEIKKSLSIFGNTNPLDYSNMDFSEYQTFGYSAEYNEFYKGSYSGRGNYYEIMVDDTHVYGNNGIKVDYTYASYKTSSDYNKHTPSSQEFYTAIFEKNEGLDDFPYRVVKIENNMSVLLTEDNWVPLCVTDVDGIEIPLEDVFGEDKEYYNRLVFYDEDSGFENDYGLTLLNYTNGNPDGMRWGDFTYDDNLIFLYADFAEDAPPLVLTYGEYLYHDTTFKTLSWKDCVKYSSDPSKEYVIIFAQESIVIDSEEYLGNMMN